jgi:hypothetical protein
MGNVNFRLRVFVWWIFSVSENSPEVEGKVAATLAVVESRTSFYFGLF